MKTKRIKTLACQIRPPTRKRDAPLKKPIPFPVPLASEAAFPAAIYLNWPCYEGHLHGKVVLVKKIEHAKELISKGYFGHWLNASGWSEGIPQNQTCQETSVADLTPQCTEIIQKEEKCSDEMEAVAVNINDGDVQNFPGSSETVVDQTSFWLCLSLEEAFFLLYALGCLMVFDGQQKKLNAEQMWKVCSAVQPRFMFTYFGYHFYRCKGWVVKQEMKFGCDFLLYKYGPPYYHASYSVIVQAAANENIATEAFKPLCNLTWTKLAGLNRITEHVSKELLICYVVFSKDLISSDFNKPSCILSCEVQELTFHRWIPPKEREKTIDK